MYFPVVKYCKTSLGRKLTEEEQKKYDQVRIFCPICGKQLPLSKLHPAKSNRMRWCYDGGELQKKYYKSGNDMYCPKCGTLIRNLS